ncbi:HTH-type transcriptional activator AmpR [Sphingomonas antarctica]|uniref:LysR family transcriptional regulator n=1 Tax=Sphingomonas antarctica TaxID=2040274 RepID=UPI0039E7CAE0
MKRTHLPLNGLRVFDAAARHLSFTRAADELAVTPAAVGQQIRALEDTLGLVLFRRTPKGLELTPEGEAGLVELRKGFLNFEEAVRAMQAGQSSQSLTIAAPRDLTARWLAPRLAAYRQDNPDLRLHLIASENGLDFTEANLDLAICWADGPGEHEGMPIGPRGFATVGKGAAIAWRDGPEVEGATLTVADAGLAFDAALAGLGQALIPALIAAAEPTSEDPRGYWLVAPLPQWRQKKVRALVGALSI